MNTKQNILVTGATGFLGGHLVERLICEGYGVDFIARDKIKAKPLMQLGESFIHQDLSTKFSLNKKYDAVYHCAALSKPWGKYENFYSANMLATLNLVNAMQESGSDFLIHISSPSIYFNFKDRFNIKETDPLGSKFVNHYVETKK